MLPVGLHVPWGAAQAAVAESTSAVVTTATPAFSVRLSINLGGFNATPANAISAIRRKEVTEKSIVIVGTRRRSWG